MSPQFDLARELAEDGRLDEAWKLCEQFLGDTPEDPHAMILATFILEKRGDAAVAYHLAKRLTQMHPREPAGWQNFGRCADTLWRMDEARSAFRQAIKLARNDRTKTSNLVNLGACLLQIGKFSESIPHSLEACKLEPENRKAHHNLGIAQLARRQWREGWPNYAQSVGSGNRLAYSYTGEGAWDGTKGLTVVAYGEQGLGDEINAASCYADAIRDCKKFIIDCDPRLTNLYKRSFPQAKVYGTRMAKSINWAEEDRQIDANVAAMQVHQFYRNRTEDFDGKPYLVADPDRVAMWRGLWATKGKPIIGIGWTGGIKQTGAKYRHFDLEDMMPVFRSVDAHWVCLQYKDAAKEIEAFRAKHPEVDLVQYPFATLTKDYDDTAALVASLDLVVSVQTTVIHLAGALGVPTLCGVAKCGQWRYGEQGETMPWYQSVRLFRQDSNGKWPFSDVAKKVPLMLIGDLKRAA